MKSSTGIVDPARPTIDIDLASLATDSSLHLRMDLATFLAADLFSNLTLELMSYSSVRFISSKMRFASDKSSTGPLLSGVDIVRLLTLAAGTRMNAPGGRS